MIQPLDKRLKKDYAVVWAYIIYGGPKTIELVDENRRKIEISRAVSTYFPVSGMLVEVDDPKRGKVWRITDDDSPNCRNWFLLEVHENYVPYVLTDGVELIKVAWEGMNEHHFGLLIGCKEAAVLEFRERVDRRYRMGVLVLMGPRYPWELSGVAVAVGHQTYRATGVSRSPRGELWK